MKFFIDGVRKLRQTIFDDCYFRIVLYKKVEMLAYPFMMKSENNLIFE